MNNKLEKKQNSALFYLFPIAITVIFIILRLSKYVVLDDLYLHNIAASGSFNEHSEFLMCSSVILGYLYKFLYFLAPAVNWFSVTQIIFVTVLFELLIVTASRYDYLPVSTLILSLCQVYMLAQMTFTAIAFVGAATGMIWGIEHADCLSKQNIKHLIFSFIIVFISLAIRPGSTFLCIFLISIPVCFFAYKNQTCKLSVVCLLLVLLVVSNYANTGIGNIYRSHISDELYYNQFQEYRAKAYDEGILDYYLHQEEFEKAGLSQNDIELFEKAMFADKNVYSADAVKTIAESRTFREKYNINIIEIVRNIIFGEAKIQNFTVFFAMFALIILILLKDKRAETFLIAFFVSGAIGYLHFRRRGLPRVTNPIAIVGIMLLTFVLIKGDSLSGLVKKFKFNKTLFLKCTAFVCIIAVIGYIGLYYRQDKITSCNVTQITEDIKQSDCLYVSDSWTGNDFHNLKLTLKESDFDQIPVSLVFGTWYIYSYYWYDYFDERSIEDYATDAFHLLLREDVRFVSGSVEPESIVTYFDEHYSEKVGYQVINTYDDSNIRIYQFYYL